MIRFPFQAIYFVIASWLFNKDDAYIIYKLVHLSLSFSLNVYISTHGKNDAIILTLCLLLLLLGLTCTKQYIPPIQNYGLAYITVLFTIIYKQQLSPPITPVDVLLSGTNLILASCNPSIKAWRRLRQKASL